MKENHDIEARLERSLGNQIAAPQLGREFNESVWSRIADADEHAAPAQKTLSPGTLAASRWLAVSNAVGVTVALSIAVYFGVHAFARSGMSVSIDVPLPAIPEISEATMLGWMTQLGYVIGASALAFGLGRTSFGRRILANFG